MHFIQSMYCMKIYKYASTRLILGSKYNSTLLSYHFACVLQKNIRSVLSFVEIAHYTVYLEQLLTHTMLYKTQSLDMCLVIHTR